MESSQYRRRFLQASGVTAITALAGCSQLNSLNDDGTDDDGDSDGDGSSEADIDPEDGVLTQVGPDDEEAERVQQEVMVEAEENEWSQQEAHEEFQSRMEALVAEELAEFETWADQQDDIRVAGRVDEIGAVLLDGTDEALMAALRGEELDVLLPGARFTEIQDAIAEQEEQMP